MLFGVKYRVCVEKRFFVNFQLSFVQRENLVEQKSVLDCGRISRNFSHTRGQQNRPNKKIKRGVKNQSEVLTNPLFFNPNFNTKKIINSAMEFG
jgi:hypothetical protein